MKKSFILIPIVASLALGAGYWAGKWRQSSSPLIVDNQRVDFNLPDTNGVLHSAKEWQNKILMINIWATWCPSCIEEMKDLNALQAENEAVAFVGIAIDEDSVAVGKFLTDNPANYPILVGGDIAMALAKQWGDLDQSIPFTVIFNAQGNPVSTHQGPLTKEQFYDLTDPLLNHN